MKIHEYQAKAIFRTFGIPVPNGFPAFSIDESVSAAEKLSTMPVIVKAQIHAGGRGKGGGVKLARSIEEVKMIASKILGMNLITHQTGSQGRIVNRLLIEEGVSIEKEFYAGIVLDRSKEKFAMIVSTEGGVEIEKVASATPEKIVKSWIDPDTGLTDQQTHFLGTSLGLAGDQLKQAQEIFLKLWQLFQKCDCSLIEINPLLLTREGKVLALDAKMNIDDNALARQPDIVKLRDLSEELPSEIEASKHRLNYIKLDGNVGCMVNGAGLAMATMDIIKLAGGEPANFLDVGGVASAETVENGFQLILQDHSVKSILINIFGGIVRCDRVAQGVIDALEKIEVKIPVVVRLEGTNAEIAAKMFNESTLNFIVATTLKDASVKVVQSTKGSE